MAILTSAEAPSQTKSYQGIAQRLLSWRTVDGFGRWDGVILSLFFAVAAYAVHFHEAWDDEAQAWLIARDNSVWQIVRTRLHYEGAPPAWHLLLHLFHALGGTYQGIGWLSVALATVAIYVWLRWSPFPLLIRYLFPFTFFLEYQYAVIARSYVLVPLLMFLLCVLFTRRRHVIWFAAVAGILANISLQGFALAFAMAGLYAFECYRLNGVRISAVKRQARPAALLFAAMACVAIYCAIPAPDLDFAIGDQVSTGTVHRILVTLVGETPRNAPRPQVEKPIDAPFETWPEPNWRTQPRAWLAELIYPRKQATDHTALRWPFRTFGPVVLEFVDQSAWSLSNSTLLALAFFSVVVLWLRARGQLRMLWPWLALMATSRVLWIAEHHAGMLLVALVAGIWMAAQSPAPRDASVRTQNALLALFAAILLGQVAWTVRSIHAEVHGAYDPGPETAQWLKDQGKQKMAAFGFATVSIQPWFPRSPFYDVPASWWQWSSNVEVDGIHHHVLDEHPDIVVYGLEFPGTDLIRDQVVPLTHISQYEEQNLPHDFIVRDLHQHGYRETHRFCGARFTRLAYAYRVCDLIFEPVP